MPDLQPRGDRAETSSRAWSFRRVAVIATGWIFVCLGIAGLFLPFLQGILFLLVGLIILSREYHWAHRWLLRLRSRYPKVDHWLEKAHSWVDAMHRKPNP